MRVRDRDDGIGSGIVKLGLGMGIGFAVYMWFGGSGGWGFGRGEGAGRGEGRGEGPQPPQPPETLPPTRPPAPALPKDERPLLLWVVSTEGPAGKPKFPDPTSRARAEAGFRIVDLGSAELAANLWNPAQDELHKRVSEQLRRDDGTPPMSLDEVIARVKAGGRDDVRLMTSGGIRSGIFEDAKDALLAAGLKHWLLWEEAPADRKPGAPPKPARWDLYDKYSAVGNPDKTGHYHVENRGTAYWNLKDSAPHVSGAMVGRGYYRR